MSIMLKQYDEISIFFDLIKVKRLQKIVCFDIIIQCYEYIIRGLCAFKTSLHK